MWSKLRRKRQKSPKRTETKNAKKPKIKKKDEQHHYFKGHKCSIPPNRQTKYDEMDNRSLCWKIILYLTAVRSEDIRARYMFRSYAALSAEVHRQYMFYSYSIHPFSRLRLAVEAISFVDLQICTIVVTHYFVTDPSDKYSVFAGIIYACEILYLLNIIASFFTGYERGYTARHVVLDVKKTAWRYIRTWLIIDLMFCSGMIVYHINGISCMWDMILISVKVLKVPTLLQYAFNLMEVMDVSNVTKTVVEIILMLLNYILWNLYFQFAMEYVMENSFILSDPRECSWLKITQAWNASNYGKNVIGFTRAVGMLRQNTNILEEIGCHEEFFIIAWIIGRLLLIHCIMKYTLMVLGLESAKAKYFIMLNQVQTYMEQRRFPARIKKKILSFYAVRYRTHFFMEHRMMDCVSGQLREDIIMHSGRQLVGEVQFLKQLPKSLLLQIGMKLKLVIFLAGDIIYKINTVGDCLYFIDKGTIAIYSESGQEICHLQDGDFFGEIALVRQPCFRNTSAVAVSNCELFRLDKKDFDSTIAVYPTVYESIKKVAFHRLERSIVIDEHHKAELKKGNELVEDEMP